MSELVQTGRTPEMVAAEIRAFTTSMLRNVIEIGRRMCEIKEMLPHGEFGDWIEINTGYSKSTANNFMRMFKEYGADQGSLFGTEVKCQTFGNLSYSKALTLLALPAEEREEYVKNNDVENMSARELKQAIKERDEAIKRAEEAEKQLDTVTEKAAEIDAELSRTCKEVEELRNRPVEVAVQEPDDKVIEERVASALTEINAKHKAELDKLAQSLDKETKKTEKLNKALEKAKADAERAAATDEKERLSAEVERLQKQLAMSGAEITAFKLHFSAWQNMYRQMMDSLASVDEENRERLKSAVRAQIDAWNKA